MEHTKWFEEIQKILDTACVNMADEENLDANYDLIWGSLQNSYLESMSMDLSDAKKQMKDHIFERCEKYLNPKDKLNLIVINFLAVVAHLGEGNCNAIDKEYRYNQE
jgi:hypothetical protein